MQTTTLHKKVFAANGLIRNNFIHIMSDEEITNLHKLNEKFHGLEKLSLKSTNLQEAMAAANEATTAYRALMIECQVLDFRLELEQ